MNYRHGFHAGNFADCVKHALLGAILDRLKRKEAPFGVWDTHAGPGLTALDGPEATRGGEWRDGIGRLLDDTPAALAPFVARVRAAGGGDATRYPGSPLLARAALRPQDRLVACELHEGEAATLRRNLGGDARCAVHARDGYEAIRALLPPRAPPHRGLVLIDPPFEARDEWDRVAVAINEVRARFPAAIVAAWYPIKGRAPARALADRLVGDGVRDLVAYEFLRRPPLDPAQLNGCGVLVANNPYGLEDAAGELLSALATRLRAPDAAAADADADSTWRIERLAAE